MEKIEISKNDLRFAQMSMFHSRRLLQSMSMALVVGSFAICDISFAENTEKPAKKPKITYAGKTELDFDGAQIEGELRNPGDFYFQHKPQDKMDSLVKRRKNFHREMLRDVVLSK